MEAGAGVPAPYFHVSGMFSNAISTGPLGGWFSQDGASFCEGLSGGSDLRQALTLRTNRSTSYQLEPEEVPNYPTVGKDWGPGYEVHGLLTRTWIWDWINSRI